MDFHKKQSTVRYTIDTEISNPAPPKSTMILPAVKIMKYIKEEKQRKMKIGVGP